MKQRKFKTLFSPILLILLVIFIYSMSLSEQKEKQNVPMPDRLHPLVAERSNQLVEQAAAKGITIVITDEFRSVEEQDQLYRQGRSTDGNIVTYAKGGESYHNYGLAVDFAIKLPSGAVIWDRQHDGNGNGISDWTEVVNIAKSLGFEWGGDWEGFKDYPHLQMNFGLTIRDLQQGERPPGQIQVAEAAGRE